MPTMQIQSAIRLFTQLGLLEQVGGGDVAKRDHVTFHLGKTTFEILFMSLGCFQRGFVLR